MRVPLSWLREYVTVDATPEEIARRLAISALDVERIIDVGVPDLDGNVGRFLVGRVLEVEAHPNADRLRVCQVDVGEGDARQIVCGAWNFEAGATVAVALPGAYLPIFDAPLDERELRGQPSRGMILAEDEVGLGDDHAGIMVLPDGLEPGRPLVDVLPIRDRVLDVIPTVNRVDLLSMVGIAREVAALLDGELHEPEVDDPPVVDEEPVDVGVEDLEGCPRYIGRVFRDVAIGASPQWLRSRLHLADMRSISNVVDVTNYVMHVWGSPLHVFDRSKLAGGRIVVRRARPGEELRTLDGVTRVLDPGDLVIADAERPVALAAIMGGEESEVSERDDRGPSRGRELRAARDPRELGAARAQDGRLEPLGEGRRSAPRRARREARQPSDRGPRGRAHDRDDRRPGTAARASGRPLPSGPR